MPVLLQHGCISVEKYMIKNQNKPSKHATPASKIKQLSERELAQACGGDTTITQQYVKS